MEDNKYPRLVTDDVAKCTTRTVQDQVAGSDHRPVMFTVELNTNQSSSYVPLVGNLRELTGVNSPAAPTS